MCMLMYSLVASKMESTGQYEWSASALPHHWFHLFIVLVSSP
jgi:hypothetical protein